MTADEIVESLMELIPGPKWVVVSGGNPMMHDLSLLVQLLHKQGYKMAVETQGTKRQPWATQIDSLAVSPKPPSAGQGFDMHELTMFLRMVPTSKTFLKIVVFNQVDYDFAKVIHAAFPGFPMFLSAGNDSGATVGNPSRKDNRSQREVAIDLINRGRWLVNRTMVDPLMNNVRVQTQFHVLLWGNEKGK